MLLRRASSGSRRVLTLAADRRHRRRRAHPASSRRDLGDPAAAPPSGARGRGRDHPGPGVQGAPHPRRRHRLPAGRLSRVLGADGAPYGLVRGERRDPAPLLGGRAVLLPRQALHARGRGDSAAALPDLRAAAVVRRQRGGGRAPGRTARRRVRGHAQHQPRERDGAGRYLQGRRAQGRTRRRSRADARRVGGSHPRGGRPGLRPARHDRLSLLLGSSAGGVPEHAARHQVHAGEPGARPADPRRSGGVRT